MVYIQTLGHLFEFKNFSRLFESLEVEAISRLLDFLIDGALELMQLDSMPTLVGILRSLYLTGCAFWTCGLAPRLPFLDGLTLAFPPFR